MANARKTIWACIFALAVCVCAPFAGNTFTVEPKRLGSVYRRGETAAFTCAGVVDKVDVTVCDGRLRKIASRVLSVGTDGNACLALSFRDLGERYGAYRVTFRAASETHETWCAFLPGERRAPNPFYGTGSHAAHGWGRGEFRYLDLLAEAGIGSVRDDLFIEEWEDGAGGFTVPEKVSAFVRELRVRGVRPNLILAMRRPYTREGLSPDRFARWATFLANTFRGEGVSFEIWNEPQNFAFKEVYGGTYHGPEAKWIPEFVTFTQRVKEAFKAAKYDNPVLLTAEDYLPALKPMIEMGIAEKGEIISIHPYCHAEARPERGTWFFDDDGQSIRALAAAHGGCDRFWATEAGWTTVSSTGKVEHAFVGGYPRVTYVEQAQYVARMFLIARQLGLERAFQYDFVNDGANRFYTEHNFGLVNEDYSPKPSYVAVAAQIALMGDAVPRGDEGNDRKRLRLYRFQMADGRPAYAAWTVEGAATVTVPSALGLDYGLFDMFGNPLAKPKDGKLALSEEPIYIVSL